MTYKIFFLSVLAILISVAGFSQARTKAQRDSATFARLIIASKEFKQEKHKMDSVFKATGKVAIAAFEIQMDEPTADKEDKPARKTKADKDDADEKEEKPAKKEPVAEEDNFMTATIIEQQGAANVVIYEAKYDRKKHQVVSIRPVSDGLDISIDSE